jgi:2-polyprenyl-6-hydroxyphenyl methylase/3-demethylubiquinone-9 3-methyltransferase
MIDSSTENQDGNRFAFGNNWRTFTELINEARIQTAIDSLTGPLGTTDLQGRTFLDIGCGSGLFSLAASRLGASVRSFDFDSESVEATIELRRRFKPSRDWIVEQGSILDAESINDLGHFDIVYSWGVLHHTGDLWKALEITAGLVAAGGLLYISVYNCQGIESHLWPYVKRRYNRSGPLMRQALLAGSATYLDRRLPVRKLVQALRPDTGMQARPPRARGMSAKHDLIDWVGGYPFEVAKPEQVFTFLHERGFELRYLVTCAGGIGCNEYVFERTALMAGSE